MTVNIPVSQLGERAGVEFSISREYAHQATQQTGDNEPALDLCLDSVADDRPTLTQNWFNASCLLDNTLTEKMFLQ